MLEDPETAKTCLYDTDQTGLNLLLAMEGLKPRNLNLPPYPMEATWAGDYPGEFESLWKDPSESRYLFTGRDRFSTRIVPSTNSSTSFSQKMRRPSGALNKRCDWRRIGGLAYWP